ncbi:hypothetical protein AVEN_234119-1 [Araneus ventricosus]|uniref:BEN domain-containing protein n=1 Tax=Araneus ventricosus TaxID=182803 RepID=A0A4Y2GNB4_ARAVE|nr:hypothetical protein AVEN_234119-1 [Araneus ventricosus]
MKLKDCIPHIDDDYNFDTWDPKEIIEVLWDNGKPYPANILQFGEIERLQNELAKIESSLQETKRKYKEIKLKYKEKKRQMKEENKEVQGETMKFGAKTVPAAKLVLCRTDYSKYVGDLLDICFGRETLSESVLKCSKSRTSKTNVLDEGTINDIMAHVVGKYWHGSSSHTAKIKYMP